MNNKNVVSFLIKAKDNEGRKIEFIRNVEFDFSSVASTPTNEEKVNMLENLLNSWSDMLSRSVPMMVKRTQEKTKLLE